MRSKSRYAALDKTAVFGSICRHEFPQRFLNMKHGERYVRKIKVFKKSIHGALLKIKVFCILII